MENKKMFYFQLIFIQRFYKKKKKMKTKTNYL